MGYISVSIDFDDIKEDALEELQTEELYEELESRCELFTINQNYFIMEVFINLLVAIGATFFTAVVQYQGIIRPFVEGGKPTEMHVFLSLFILAVCVMLCILCVVNIKSSINK